LIRSLRELRKSRAWRRSGGAMPTQPFCAPATRFNQRITPNRIFAHVNLALPELIEVKRRVGCTLNDVYLALVGGSLRSILATEGEAYGAELTAAVPVSVRTEVDEPAFGNALAYWFATTGSHVADPLERLMLVAENTGVARALFALRDPRLAVEWLDHWVLRHCYLDGVQRIAASILRRPSCNVIVSNVKGPIDRLYSNGAQVEELFSMGPLSRQQGLNFTAWSYLDTFAIGVHGCREHVPDIARLANGLSAELEILAKELRLR
jgi:diacylglycerol O-acyltransferase